MRVPGYPWLPGFALLLQILILAAIVGTQPRLALGGGAMLLALVIAGILAARRGPPPRTAEANPIDPLPQPGRNST